MSFVTFILGVCVGYGVPHYAPSVFRWAKNKLFKGRKSKRKAK